MNLSPFLSQTLAHPIWQAKQGHGSFLTFDMGNRSVRNRPDGTEYIKGDIHLWIYLCDWVIKQEDKELCFSESPHEQIAEVLKLFIGSTLRDIATVSPTQLDLNFSNGLLIILSNNTGFYAKDDDFFSLSFRDSNTYLSYNQKDGFKIADTSK
jgi:hypothetical protein